MTNVHLLILAATGKALLMVLLNVQKTIIRAEQV